LFVEQEEVEAIVRIRDSGIGIAPDVLPHVFELFVQADPSSRRADAGLGIGLALVRSLVERHGGRVTAASAGAGHGSEFTVRLPRPTGSFGERHQDRGPCDIGRRATHTGGASRIDAPGSKPQSSVVLLELDVAVHVLTPSVSMVIQFSPSAVIENSPPTSRPQLMAGAGSSPRISPALSFSFNR
jgi:hypothetical protein